MTRKLTPLKTIRLKCLECSAGQTLVIKNCKTESCPLFLYRFGTNPKRKGIGGGINNFIKINPKSGKTAKISPRSHELNQVVSLVG